MKKIVKFSNNFIIKIVSSIVILTLLIYIFSGIFSISYGATTGNVQNLDNSKYPGIRNILQDLKASHPNWNFTILYTGLDWNTVIANESVHNRNVVPKDKIGEWLCQECKKTNYEDNWKCASSKTIAYYMDPRNFLSEKNILQFETLYYVPETQNIEGVKKILSGTFLSADKITYTDTTGATQTINKSYAQVIMESATATGVSPYHLAARVRQEQGAGNITTGQSTSGTGCGTYTGYVGYYNYFNIGASGINRVAAGLDKAKEQGWTNPEKAISGGAYFLKNSYIGVGQDTLYLQKFSVYNTNGSLYWHQYMTNIMAPTSESTNIFDKVYSSFEDIKNSKMNFVIPVYENMPAQASPIPSDTLAEHELIETEKQVRILPTLNFSNLQQELKNKGTISLLDNQGNVLTDTSILKTGQQIRLTSGANVTNYAIAKLGDVNGDGEVDARDALRILRYSVEEIELKNEYLRAVDSNGDGQYDARDALRVLNYSIESSKIEL